MTPRALVLGAIGAVVAVAGLRMLSDATLSTHQPVPPDSRIEVIVDGRTKGNEAGQTLDEEVEAQIVICRLEVSSDLVGEIEEIAPGRFRALLSPSMDKTNQRQFRGCLEDWVIDQVRLDVVSLAPV